MTDNGSVPQRTTIITKIRNYKQNVTIIDSFFSAKRVSLPNKDR